MEPQDEEANIDVWRGLFEGYVPVVYKKAEEETLNTK